LDMRCVDLADVSEDRVKYFPVEGSFLKRRKHLSIHGIVNVCQPDHRRWLQAQSYEDPPVKHGQPESSEQLLYLSLFPSPDES